MTGTSETIEFVGPTRLIHEIEQLLPAYSKLEDNNELLNYEDTINSKLIELKYCDKNLLEDSYVFVNTLLHLKVRLNHRLDSGLNIMTIKAVISNEVERLTMEKISPLYLEGAKVNSYT